MWQCEWWKIYKIDVLLKEHIGDYFPYKRPLRQDRSLDKNSGASFGYVQCGINHREHMRKKIAVSSHFLEKHTYMIKTLTFIARVG